MNTPFVSIIIPCRNEEVYISRCLESLLNQTYPRDLLEIIVVDGMSTDTTREIVENYHVSFPALIRLISNEKKITAVARNLGITAAKGEIVCFFDAHATYATNYIMVCVGHLQSNDVDAVGGMFATVASTHSRQARAIACVLSSQVGSGNSRFRVGVKTPQLVDTVFGACYRKEVFDRIGIFNERLIRSQDMEFNLRLIAAGGKILLAPQAKAEYYPKSTLLQFFFHNISDGIWALQPLKITGRPLRLRHYVPLLFVASLLTLTVLGLFFSFFLIILVLELMAYLGVTILASLQCARKNRDMLLLCITPPAFWMRHIGYGIGSLIGIIK